MLTFAELRLVLAAADKLECAPRAFVCTLVLCGQRRGETSLIRWKHLMLDCEQPSWFFPAENVKNHKAHDVPLSPEMVRLIKALPRLGEHVLSTGAARHAGRWKKSTETVKETLRELPPLSGFLKFKKKLDDLLEEDRNAAGSKGKILAHWTWHDLRRSTVTGMADLGIAPHVIEEVLNQIFGAMAGVAGLYNKSRYCAERRLAFNAWSQHVAGVMRQVAMVHNRRK